MINELLKQGAGTIPMLENPEIAETLSQLPRFLRDQYHHCFHK